MSNDYSDELVNEFYSIIDELKAHKQHIKGIMYGLFYGIVGNIAVSHYYGVFEGLVKSNYDITFKVNLFVLIVALLLIIVVSWDWYTKLRALDEEEKETFEELKKIVLKKADKLKMELQEEIAELKKMKQNQDKECEKS